MSEFELFLSASRKLAHDKVFNFFTKRSFLYKKLLYNKKNIIALNFYIDINELMYERRMMLKVSP